MNFDAEVEAYDRVRPSYPEALFGELVSYLGGAPPWSLLEIGPGTGKATASLVKRGFQVTAVEPGPRMCEFLRSRFPGVTIVNARFEEADLPWQAFDCVLAATSFHWVDPRLGLRKAARLLRPGGVVAIVNPIQIASSVDQGFFDRCQPLYARHGGDERKQAPPREDEVEPSAFRDLRGVFHDVRLFRYRWDQEYSTGEYLDLVRSYSGTQSMEPGSRERLLADLDILIEEEFEGRVVRPLVMTLVVGRSRLDSDRPV